MSKPIQSVCISLVLAASIATAFAQQPPPPPGGEAQAETLRVVAQGRVIRYMLNPRGEVDGLLLNDGTQVRFPPHMSAELTGAVSIDDPVTVQGFRELSDAVRAFAITDLRTSFKLDYLWACLCITAAVYFVFRGAG